MIQHDQSHRQVSVCSFQTEQPPRHCGRNMHAVRNPILDVLCCSSEEIPLGKARLLQIPVRSRIQAAAAVSWGHLDSACFHFHASVRQCSRKRKVPDLPRRARLGRPPEACRACVLSQRFRKTGIKSRPSRIPFRSPDDHNRLLGSIWMHSNVLDDGRSEKSASRLVIEMLLHEVLCKE